MSGVIDTNILLYAVNTDAQEHKRARAFVHDALRSRDQWYLTEGILYEFLRVSTHARVFSEPLSWQQSVQFLAPFLASANFTVLAAADEHWELLADVLRRLTHPSGNIFFDVRTVVLMREHGIRNIYTTDTDFLQFADIDVTNPLRA